MLETCLLETSLFGGTSLKTCWVYMPSWRIQYVILRTHTLSRSYVLQAHMLLGLYVSLDVYVVGRIRPPWEHMSSLGGVRPWGVYVVLEYLWPIGQTNANKSMSFATHPCVASSTGTYLHRPSCQKTLKNCQAAQPIQPKNADSRRATTCLPGGLKSATPIHLAKELRSPVYK